MPCRPVLSHRKNFCSVHCEFPPFAVPKAGHPVCARTFWPAMPHSPRSAYLSTNSTNGVPQPGVETTEAMLYGDEREDWSMLKQREYSWLSLAFQKMSLRLVFQVGALKASLAYLREGARRAWEVEKASR